ncbi:MAG: hypothetical protein KME56_10355 [Candidatus Thiodiazotropha sp. (ex Ctena orbiculata)]|uniref:Uncharacterized protein n=1 Tax=Candidatus Thiodiazotropha taylori TaxID=2792791 RepID=A0A944M992_9GAMM|nr:hypothetical protein [Candidatus Thiodiazotropha taylori]MBT2989440.1 hypothetical protein [Candidatus Thiodiazotropha taylori]MBT2997020.1 hypothetical protein [Candidatus Thiodiazotropha taylori]MBT3000875.1 hypothetical protein [Candidatus Thiodiazotropha taylori]MBT3027012.1 hypothetical protein [Candidatus Thiodiazotropha taylori]
MLTIREKPRPLGIDCQWEGVPDEAFMVKILDSSAMKGVEGVARFHKVFDLDESRE